MAGQKLFVKVYSMLLSQNAAGWVVCKHYRFIWNLVPKTEVQELGLSIWQVQFGESGQMGQLILFDRNTISLNTITMAIRF